MGTPVSLRTAILAAMFLSRFPLELQDDLLRTFMASSLLMCTLLRKLYLGIRTFSKLLPKRLGSGESMLATQALEKPIEQKNSSLGKRVFSGSTKSSEGSLVTILVIWVLVHPDFLRRVRTESGFLGFSKCIFSDAEIAVSGDNPHEFTR